MKRLSLKFTLILVSLVLGCYAISMVMFAFLAPQQAHQASISTFNTITWIMNTIPVVLGIAGICVLVSRLLKNTQDVFNLRKSWYEGTCLALKNKQLIVETLGQDQFKTVEEGNAVFLGPRYRTMQPILLPRTPRIERVTEVSSGQEQLLRQEQIPPMFDMTNDANLQRFDSFYFGETIRGPLHVSLEDAYHIMDIAESGNGKSNRFRFLMAQAVKKGCETYFLSPVANGVKPLKKNDDRVIEVWQPIFDRLAEQPKKEFHDIEETLQKLVQEIYIRRAREARFDTKWTNNPLYVFIDELPQIFKNCPKAVSSIATLATLGRQFFVFACIAAQGALVKTIGLNTDEIACFKTKIYGGGGRISANNLLPSKVTDEQERALKSTKGLSLMLTEGVDELTFVRAPRTTNEAIFDYLECGPFVLEQWLQERPYEIQHQQEYTQEPIWTPSVEVEKAPSYSLGFTGLPSVSTISTQAVETPLKVSDQKQRALTEDEKFAVFNAINQIEHEGRRLTLNAIKTRTGLSWTVDAALKELCTKLNKPLV